MQSLPPHIMIREVGPREGFQSEKTFIPTQAKAEIIDTLSMAGFRHIQVVSFVRPDAIPQMADAEALCRKIRHRAGTRYSALALNKKGVLRCSQVGLSLVEIGASASDVHSRNNVGMGREAAMDAVEEMAELAHDLGLCVWADIQCAFACPYDGPIKPSLVVNMARRMISVGIKALCIADTAGMAGPGDITRLLREIRKLSPKTRIVLHLHDTRGLGLANILAGIYCGVDAFDASFGGLGGCPFSPGSSGNVATEALLFMLANMGLSTDVEIKHVRRATRIMEKYLGRPLYGAKL